MRLDRLASVLVCRPEGVCDFNTNSQMPTNVKSRTTVALLVQIGLCQSPVHHLDGNCLPNLALTDEGVAELHV